jgi:hypothetical protein
MRHNRVPRAATVLLLTTLVGGCDQLGLGNRAPEQPEVPSAQELGKISYLPSAASTPNGRKVYSHFAIAKSCEDFQLAMRWNRPPNIAGGSFGKKMVYLTSTFPADLPKESEVFISGTIVKGDRLVGGGQAWYLHMQDGTVVQAAEMGDYIAKQEQETQGDKLGALNQPDKPGRVFCGHGIYQGVMGRDPDGTQDKKVPLVSMLYAMDRDR